ncbi:Dual specificity kinase pom1 [Lecanosticta acicola]|uniref:Dual specificity kinase pom1 n=1 Tax=Lecanosticta acicola TaxID=111012 RepID=A0AAI8Z2E1_9PEZI|nr:Dual specificity kinase pom1 [Lecanosticta acicola]
MDVASRLYPRARTQSYLDQERNNNLGMTEDSGTECEMHYNMDPKRTQPVTDQVAASESLIRRKFQRTTSDENTNDEAFRKPSLPASATRPSAEQRPVLGHHRRRSTLRENARVPSGPREFPSPGKRTASGSNGLRAPSMAEPVNTSRSFLPNSTSEPFFSKTGEATHFSFANPPPTGGFESPTTPAEPGKDFDFIPSVSFDDLQNSIANYDGNGPLLGNFTSIEGGRQGLNETGRRGIGYSSSRPPVPRLEARDDAAVSRSQSFRRRLSAVAGGKQNNSNTLPEECGVAPPQANNRSLRSRRQSTAPQGPPPSGPAPNPAGAGSRQPRKSVGPGIIASMMEGRKASQPLSSAVAESALKGHTRTNSLSKASRRTTMQPTSAGVELPRNATFTATTQSRANKVKSLQPPPHEPDPNTPNARSTSKNSPNRAHTPSSSGAKRQSNMSGRASGLGARTISPTDARRLKRLSMMQAPPMPAAPPKSDAPDAQEEMPQLKLDLPRFTQPSPSLIPRKTATPTSARASPEALPTYNNGGGVSLNAKSSYQSLLNSSASTSRLPTPKPRNVHSSSAQYGEDEEMVPPVPAIPKAFESPRDEMPSFTAARKSSQSGFAPHADFTMDCDLDPNFHHLQHTASESSFETRGRPSVDRPRPHQRMNTIDNIERSINAASARQAKAQIDATGRKNNNLQPLRLPPLNLMPITQSVSNKGSHLPRPSQEIESRDEYMSLQTLTQTPEPKRVPKTPSTPMTASKATFYRRQDEDTGKQQAMRSSSSQHALRDLMQLDDATAQFFENTDTGYMGIPIPAPKQRSAITPFSSGSLPKASGEFIRQRTRTSGDFGSDHTWSHFENFSTQKSKPQGPRPSRSVTKDSFQTAETGSTLESPITEQAPTENKKESTGGGLRKKLSLGWRRSSSKASTHPDNKSSPLQEAPALEKEKSKVHQRASQMPPPKLPASATWTGDIPSVPAHAARPSLDSLRRKSTNVSVHTLSTVQNSSETELASQATPPVKTKSVHTEQPQPVHVNPASRATSWSTSSNTRPVNPKVASSVPKTRQVPSNPVLSAIVKDKDDLVADDEMRRLSQKRKDVDSAARESEELKKRAVARSPMTPERVLHDRSCNLNIFERGEIVDYEKDGIYFTGTKNARKIIGSLTPSPHPSDGKDSKAGNYGYDDERGDYNIVLGDHLAYRYEVVDVLGKGSFGQVVRCVDHRDGGVVAIKIIRNKKRFHQQALVEVGILGRLRDWDPDGAHATLSITSSFYFRSHLCIVTPCLSINLYELIRAHNFVGFNLPLIRRFSRQLLSCLVLLQNKRIIHCDLKPENILLCEARKADVRVIDFGSSCKEEEKVYTYIQSRFYRSPEVILGSSYGLGIDMWSLGCILAELWTGYPLFPGENEQEQLACIMEIFGPPDRHLVERCTRKKLFFDSVGKPRVTVSSKGRRRRPSSKTLSQALKTDDEAFLDFITRCLRWDSDRRMKPHEAINHPFITNQPFHQRPGIPDEARRAAKLRSTAAVPAVNGSVSSPVKRMHTTSGTHANSTLPQQAQQTPGKDRTRPLPETPQTALRNGVAASNANTHANQMSPSKQTGLHRRQSTAFAGSAQGAGVGSKRVNNLAPASTTAATSGPAGQRQGSANSAGLAQMAAREANAARWRA